MSSTTDTALASWRDTATTRAILEFVAAATRESDEGWIPPPERVAVSDNDGTLWTAGKPALRLVVAHDDAEREVDDRGGADKVLGAGFTEISMRDDWATVFAD